MTSKWVKSGLNWGRLGQLRQHHDSSLPTHTNIQFISLDAFPTLCLFVVLIFKFFFCRFVDLKNTQYGSERVGEQFGLNEWWLQQNDCILTVCGGCGCKSVIFQSCFVCEIIESVVKEWHECGSHCGEINFAFVFSLFSIISYICDKIVVICSTYFIIYLMVIIWWGGVIVMMCVLCQIPEDNMIR